MEMSTKKLVFIFLLFQMYPTVWAVKLKWENLSLEKNLSTKCFLKYGNLLDSILLGKVPLLIIGDSLSIYWIQVVIENH